MNTKLILLMLIFLNTSCLLASNHDLPKYSDALIQIANNSYEIQPKPLPLDCDWSKRIGHIKHKEKELKRCKNINKAQLGEPTQLSNLIKTNGLYYLKGQPEPYSGRVISIFDVVFKLKATIVNGKFEGPQLIYQVLSDNHSTLEPGFFDELVVAKADYKNGLPIGFGKYQWTDMGMKTRVLRSYYSISHSNKGLVASLRCYNRHLHITGPRFNSYSIVFNSKTTMFELLRRMLKSASCSINRSF